MECCMYRSCDWSLSRPVSTAPFLCSHFGRPVVGISHEHLRKCARGFHSGMKPCYIWIAALWAVNAAVPWSIPRPTWSSVLLVKDHSFEMNAFVLKYLNNSDYWTCCWSTENLSNYWDYWDTGTVAIMFRFIDSVYHDAVFSMDT